MAGILRTDTIQNSNTSTIITQTNSTTITIGTTGQTVTLASGASSSGFGATYNGAVNWDTTPKTTTVTAVSGNGYFINTTSGAITVNLPAATAGSIVALSDYAATWNTNNVTVSPNGTNKIGGVNSNATLSTQGQSVTFVYVDSTQGWVNVGDATKVAGQTFMTATGGTITTSGNYKIHSFTGPGTFTVSSLSCAPANNFVDYVVVAGGGGAPFGAGGAGGYRISADSSPLPVSATGYPITVGSGGGVPSNGSPSVFSTITSTGGGRGGPFGNPAPVGQPGGSGGGGGAQLAASPGPGGSGNTPPVSPSQGNPGGAGSSDQTTFTNGGGGGGAGAAGSGSGGTSTSPKDGGIGRNSHVPQFGAAPQPFYPVPTGYFAGGGGGSVETGTGIGGNGGGGSSGPPAGLNGTANSGGGAAGTGGTGGSGIVLIRYKFQ